MHVVYVVYVVHVQVMFSGMVNAGDAIRPMYLHRHDWDSSSGEFSIVSPGKKCRGRPDPFAGRILIQEEIGNSASTVWRTRNIISE